MPLFSPHSRINQVPVTQIFDAVRYLMFRWGFIGTLRADNGAPFGDPTRQALSPLNLALCALGIGVKLNPPRSPVKNAKVERCQGTISRWADPAACQDHLELQSRLDQVTLDQRQHYPSRTTHNKSRAQAYPALLNNPKRFHLQDFEMRRVYQRLAKGTWQRKVSAQGVTDLFGKSYQVGYRHRGKTVTVKFEPATTEWIFYDEKGDLLKKIMASNLVEHNIRSLSFGQ